jgi:hypothetical protein
MNIKRVLIGGHPNPMRKKIPDAIEERKTIQLNIFDVLLIFPDRSPDARAWIDEVLPSFWIGDKKEILEKFWNMDKNCWMEYDYGRKTLTLCSIEK